MNSPPFSDLPHFLHNIQSQRIIIVGNGPSATGHHAGNQIDHFDRIVRINNFVTSHLETQVGSRTDIWVNGANQGLRKRKPPPENILVMIPPEVLDHKGLAIHTRIQHRLATDNYSMLPIEVMRWMEDQSGIRRPTTGFFTIYFFLLLGVDLTLHGFDFFMGSKSHYFDSPFKRWLKDSGLVRKAEKHDIQSEKLFVEKFIQSGKIKLLLS